MRKFARGWGNGKHKWPLILPLQLLETLFCFNGVELNRSSSLSALLQKFWIKSSFLPFGFNRGNLWWQILKLIIVTYLPFLTTVKWVKINLIFFLSFIYSWKNIENFLFVCWFAQYLLYVFLVDWRRWSQ